MFNAPLSVYYAPSSDGPYNLTVQQNMVASCASLLPTDYWTRPISPENREWWSIAGNYPATGIIGGGPNWPADTNTYMSNDKFTPYVQAPSTAHIAWRRQDALYGLVGGTWGQQSIVPMYFSPNIPSGPNIVYDGRCYQTLTKPMTTLVNGTMRTVPTTVWESYDLRTGEVYCRFKDAVSVNNDFL